MSRRMDWRGAQLAPKCKLSLSDEKEYRGNDAAARWLERKAHFKAISAKKRSKAGQAA